MNTKRLLIASLVLNALLVGAEAYLLTQDADDLRYRPPLVLCINHARPVTVEQTAPAAQLVTNALRSLNWRRVESEDYAQYVARLRSLGCPEQTICEIVTADVNEMFRRRSKPEVYSATSLRAMRKRIQDNLVRLAVSRQRKYQLRMRKSGRCTVCGKPVDPESRSRCLKHLILARDRKRWMRHHYDHAPNGHSTARPSGAAAVHAPPVQLAYKTDGLEISASSSNRQAVTRAELSALLDTFLTTLTWLCPINSSSTEGWLTLTVANKHSLWKVARSTGVGSPPRLIPVSGQIPAALRKIGSSRPRQSAYFFG